MGYREGRDVEGNDYKRIRRNLFQIKLCALKLERPFLYSCVLCGLWAVGEGGTYFQ